MEGRIRSKGSPELVEALRARYREGTRQERSRILDEYVKLSGYHRKHAVRLLNRADAPPRARQPGRRVYDEAVRQALVVVWEAADRVCGKRLKPVVPDFVRALEAHGWLTLKDEVREKLLAMSPATIDRLLASTRERVSGSGRRRRRATGLRKQVPVRTFADWEDAVPGEFEMDFVVHCGGSMSGQVVHSLVLTDVCSTWTECVSLAAREQSLVVDAIEMIREDLPFPLLSLDVDNDGAFINNTLIDYCGENNISLTRCRPYRKNDQCWVEQKNGSIVRRMVGYERFEGLVAAETLGRLYRFSRLYVNFFQPSFQLLGKRREGGKVRRLYGPPATPCDRLLASEHLGASAKERLRKLKERLDPIELLHRVREAQHDLAGLDSASGNRSAAPNLGEFLDTLPQLWREGESRPTHRKKPSSPRTWRTRADPFAEVWEEILGWLEEEPDATAKALFERLQARHPDEFQAGQIRTLQRRVQDWRRTMAHALVFGSRASAAGAGGTGEPDKGRYDLAQSTAERSAQSKPTPDP
jgi:hypothetical protein